MTVKFLKSQLYSHLYIVSMYKNLLSFVHSTKFHLSAKLLNVLCTNDCRADSWEILREIDPSVEQKKISGDLSVGRTKNNLREIDLSVEPKKNLREIDLSVEQKKNLREIDIFF